MKKTFLWRLLAALFLIVPVIIVNVFEGNKAILLLGFLGILLFTLADLRDKKQNN